MPRARSEPGADLGHHLTLQPGDPDLVHASTMNSRVRSAAAGSAAALVWAALEPFDRIVLRCDYSDVAVLGKWVTRGRLWPAVGLAWHAANGALFGLAFHEVRRRTRLPSRPLALAMALGEHVTLYPLGRIVDRRHPARGERGIPLLTGNRRAYAQATIRHALFGIVLGILIGRAIDAGARPTPCRATDRVPSSPVSSGGRLRRGDAGEGLRA
jgi:hypothetical protein